MGRTRLLASFLVALLLIAGAAFASSQKRTLVTSPGALTHQSQAATNLEIRVVSVDRAMGPRAVYRLTARVRNLGDEPEQLPECRWIVNDQQSSRVEWDPRKPIEPGQNTTVAGTAAFKSNVHNTSIDEFTCED